MPISSGAQSTSSVTAQSRNRCGQIALPKAWRVRSLIWCRMAALCIGRAQRLSQRCSPTPTWPFLVPINWIASR